MAAGRIRDVGARSKLAQIRALKKIGLLAEREIKLGIRRRGGAGAKFRPNALSTIVLKGSTAPLVRHGDLLGSVTFRIETTPTGGQVFAGVLRTRRGRRGESMADIALIQERGTKPFAIPVTAGVRRLFIALFLLTGGAIKPLSRTKTVINHPGVPARPFIAPAAERIKAKAQVILKLEFSRGLI